MAGPQRASLRAEAWIPVVTVRRPVIRGGFPLGRGMDGTARRCRPPPPGAYTLARRVPTSKERPWRPA
ncbi:hypothetical protein GCM10010398_36250 [Streptomyces fimbriatus]